jgi:hypothetical protein
VYRLRSHIDFRTPRKTYNFRSNNGDRVNRNVMSDPKSLEEQEDDHFAPGSPTPSDS